MKPILQKVCDRAKTLQQRKERLELERKLFLDNLSLKKNYCFFLRNGQKYFGRIRPEKGDIRLEN